jgi:hypothetical protein
MEHLQGIQNFGFFLAYETLSDLFLKANMHSTFLVSPP